MMSNRDSRSQRSTSLQVQAFSHRPQYINEPLQIMREIERKEEFQDSYGNVLKSQLIHDISSIERDYSTIERVKNNLEKIEAQKQYKLNQMDLKTKMQIEKIEKNRMNLLLKKQKHKAQQNKLKREEFLDRKKQQEREIRKQHLQKIQKNQKRMEEFENQKLLMSQQKNNFQNEYNQYNKLQEIKEMQEKQELQNIQRIMKNYEEKQNRVQETHQRILESTRAKINDGQYYKDQANKRSASLQNEKEKQHLQEIMERYDRINKAEMQKRKKDQQLMKLKQKQNKEKEEQHKENIRQFQKEKRNRQMTYQEKQLKGLNNLNQKSLDRSNNSPIKTMLDMTLEKKQLNDIRQEIVKDNKMALKQQSEGKNDEKLQKQLYVAHQRELAKKTREKILDLRMVARFRQKEDIQQSPNNSY